MSFSPSALSGLTGSQPLRHTSNYASRANVVSEVKALKRSTHLSASSKMIILCRPFGSVTFCCANILILFLTTSMPLKPEHSRICLLKKSNLTPVGGFCGERYHEKIFKNGSFITQHLQERIRWQKRSWLEHLNISWTEPGTFCTQSKKPQVQFLTFPNPLALESCCLSMKTLLSLIDLEEGSFIAFGSLQLRLDKTPLTGANSPVIWGIQLQNCIFQSWTQQGTCQAENAGCFPGSWRTLPRQRETKSLMPLQGVASHTSHIPS